MLQKLEVHNEKYECVAVEKNSINQCEWIQIFMHVFYTLANIITW